MLCPDDRCGFSNHSYLVFRVNALVLLSYRTVRRALLGVDYKDYSICLGKFFNIQPTCGETVGQKSKVIKELYQIEDDNPNSDLMGATMLVRFYNYCY